MNVRNITLSALGLAGLMAGAAHAADAPKWYENVTLGGYADAYYQQALTGDSVTQSTSLSGRAFDKAVNQFNVGGSELTLSSADDASKTSVYLDLMMGNVADAVNASNYTTPGGFMLGQAYVTKTMGPVKATMGKFGTIIGTEVTSPLADAQFSRGLVYGLEPVYSTGLKLDYSLPMSFTLTGVIDNGNSVDNAISEGKGYGLELAFAGVKNLGLSVAYYGAPLSKTASGIYYSDYLNVLASYQVMDSLSFNAEYLYDTRPDVVTGDTAFSPKIQGGALYANWATPIAGLSILPRIEQVAYPDKVDISSNAVSYVADEYTLTLKYADGPLTHFLEWRTDASNDYVYAGAKTTDDKTQSRETLTYAVAYGF